MTAVTSSTSDSSAPRAPCFVVGVGASAGGLQPLTELIGRIAGDSIAVVVVQHLSPTHASVLAQLLGRRTSARIETARQGLLVEPGCVYVIPPGSKLTLADDVLELVPIERKEGSPSRIIDSFFRSLAHSCSERAIGVLLSGSGSDGALGMRAIKEAGGVTFVQDPVEASFDGMPRSALTGGFVDFCLDTDRLATEVLRITSGQEPSLTAGRVPTDAAADPFDRLVELVRARCHNDLSHYKRATLERRIERRMAAVRVASLSAYVEHTVQHPEELDVLYDDVLINVTRFFRDGTPFEVLEATLAARMPALGELNEPLRVWVPACATGEEAYSIAILLCELFEKAPLRAWVQIFATDADPACIRIARRGVYARNLAKELSPERCATFFRRRGAEYQVTRRVREKVVFAVHDVLRQPPFSRIHLVSCRNLLIYLQPPAQSRVLHAMHYALYPGGLLLLGTSETVGDELHRFSLLDRKNKLYEKLPARIKCAPFVPTFAPHGVTTQVPTARRVKARSLVKLQGTVDSKILELRGPAAVVIDADMAVLYFQGQTMPFLRPANGVASLQLFRLVRVELHVELRRCADEAFATNERVVGKVAYRDGDEYAVVAIECVPIDNPDGGGPLLLVLLERRVVDAASDGAPGAEADGSQLQALKRELAALREYLQLILEEKEAATEELKSANEELQSANEELQSTNEELETSKEELQSTNEELTTLNEELENRMNERSVANDDLHNVLAGVDNVVVIVDLDLRLRRYTAAAEKLLGLVPSDLGRGLEYVDIKSGKVGLVEKVSSVISVLTPLEEEVLVANGRWYALRITPYRTAEHAIRGAVVTLLDIDVRKRATELARDISEYAAKFLASIGHPLLIVSAAWRIVWANEHFYGHFGHVLEETVGSPLAVLGGFDFRDEALRGLVRAALNGEAFHKHVPAQSPKHGRRMAISGNRLPLVSESALALLSIEWVHDEPLEGGA